MLIAPLLGKQIGTESQSFIIAEWIADGAVDGKFEWQAPLHRHFECDEAWYVLEGTVCVQIADEVFTATAGSVVFAERGKPHTFWNPRSEPARYLLVMTPLTKRLIDAIHATSDRSPENLRAIFSAHRAEIC